MIDKTMTFSVNEDKEAVLRQNLTTIYDALTEKEEIYYAILDSQSSEAELSGVVELTQAEYDAMTTHVADELYIIKANDEISNVMIGDEEISALYFGSLLLWQRSTGNLWTYTLEQGFMERGNPSAFTKSLRTTQALFLAAGTYNLSLTHQMNGYLMYDMEYYSQEYTVGGTASYIGNTSWNMLGSQVAGQKDVSGTISIADYNGMGGRYVQFMFRDSNWSDASPSMLTNIVLEKL